MKILIAPSIQEPHRNQFEYSISKKWYPLLSSIFGNIEIVHPEEFKKKIDLIILSGGNDLVSLVPGKKNLIRDNQDRNLYYHAKKNNIPIIGICYGAQFISKKLRCKIDRVHGHVGNHSVKICVTQNIIINKRKKFNVNSYHNYAIIKASKKIEPLCYSNDNTVELFRGKTDRCLGMMWHPERYAKTRKIDKEIFLNFYNQI